MSRDHTRTTASAVESFCLLAMASFASTPLCSAGQEEMTRQLSQFLGDCERVRVDPRSYYCWVTNNAGGFSYYHLTSSMTDVWSHFNDPGCQACFDYAARLQFWKDLCREKIAGEKPAKPGPAPTWLGPRRKKKAEDLQKQAAITNYLSRV